MALVRDPAGVFDGWRNGQSGVVERDLVVEDGRVSVARDGDGENETRKKAVTGWKALGISVRLSFSPTPCHRLLNIEKRKHTRSHSSASTSTQASNTNSAYTLHPSLEVCLFNPIILTILNKIHYSSHLGRSPIHAPVP